ncbi:cadmium-translocating P-type ATPase [Candidatus Thorarchaeota archaeon]|nr:MAG: cadmium-translocating P-type ATPase [Candidatus Thorarchaeota archaeon]
MILVSYDVNVGERKSTTTLMTTASETSLRGQKSMSAASESVCTFCAAQEARKKQVNFRNEYASMAVSIALLSVGLAALLLFGESVLATVLFLLSTLAAGKDIIPRGIRGAANIHLDVNFLMTFASFAAFLIGAPLEGAAVMLLFSVAELLEMKANDRVRVELESLLNLKPHTVSILTDDGEDEVLVEEVEPGQLIIIRPGERIGLDGTVVEGVSDVDQSPITGESIPVMKESGDIVYAGSINQNGYLKVEVSRAAGETVLARIVEEVEEAQERKAPTERLISRVSHVYTPAVVAGSVLLSFVSYLLGAPIELAVYRGLTLLVTSCPCAFAISIPVTMVSSLTGLARSGILVKGAEFIERMSQTDLVAFDKTGTLTRAELVVSGIHPVGENTQEDVISLAASLETLSEHPVSTAILEYAKANGIRLNRVGSFEAIPGYGIRGTIDGQIYFVGNRALIEEEVGEIPEQLNQISSGKSLAYLSNEREVLGMILLSDTLRTEAKSTIEAIKAMGIRTAMLTGDRSEIARQVAAELGIDDFYPGLLPSDKVDLIEKLAGEGQTIMVGDGVNDAPALAAADVGVALGGISSDIALETADIALMEEDLSKLPVVMIQSRRAMSVVKQNITASVAIKAVVAALAILGISSLWLAIGVGDMGLTLAVLANALRLVRKS